GARAARIRVQLHGRSGLSASAHEGVVLVRRRDRQDGEEARRERRRRVLRVGDAAGAARDVPGRVGRGGVEGRRGVVGDRDGEAGGGERGGGAACGKCAGARGVGVQLDRRAGLGGAADLGRVVVRGRGGGDRERARGGGRGRVL